MPQYTLITQQGTVEAIPAATVQQAKKSASAMLTESMGDVVLCIEGLPKLQRRKKKKSGWFQWEPL